jgi:hypothetical protein
MFVLMLPRLRAVDIAVCEFGTFGGGRGAEFLCWLRVRAVGALLGELAGEIDATNRTTANRLLVTEQKNRLGGGLTVS